MISNSIIDSNLAEVYDASSNNRDHEAVSLPVMADVKFLIVEDVEYSLDPAPKIQRIKNMTFKLHQDLERDGIPIGKFELCLVLMINDSNYPWFVLVPQRGNIRDAIDLSETDYQLLCEESRNFSKAIMRIFNGEKLNVAALGNVTPQLHVHHIVRFQKDAAWPAPIWGQQSLKPLNEEQVKITRVKFREAKIAGFTCF